MESSMLLTLLLFYLATNSAVAHYTPAEAKEFVDAHNCLRKEVGSPPLIWDDKLAVYAQNWCDQRAADCVFKHSMGEYGENIAGGSGEMPPAEAVKLWGDEKKLYDVAGNCCIGDPMSCRHYTQVVWNTTTCVGCGKSKCKNGWTFITCSYNPPGNYEGERPF